MKTKLQVIIAVSLVVAATIGFTGKYMIDVPFLNDSLCLWVHYIICVFSGLFGLIWLFFVGDQNDSLIRFKKDYYSLLDENKKLKQKYFSAQGNMAQLRSKLKYYKSLKINK